MAQPSRPRFPLRSGTDAGVEYRVEADRDYDLVVERRDGRHRLGACTVEAAHGSFTVLPSLDLIPGLTAPTFHGVWSVDGEGVARLQDVLLIESRH